jgi:6-pyruvoyltetrahydropterin/6-carboxytetrahydropterin synthase
MYTVAVQRSFIAQHYMIGGDWGAENSLHSHPYQVELQLHGENLDGHGFLVDIVDIEGALDGLVSYYRDQPLNELPEFAGLNPSIEHFSRILCQALAARIQAPNVHRIAVRVWEHQSAWAAYEMKR